MNLLRSFLAILLMCLMLSFRGASFRAAQPDQQSRRSVASRPISVGPNTLVSGDMPQWDHTEYMADAHPTDPNRLLLCSMYFSQERNQLASGVYMSEDGGKSWRLTMSDTTTRFGGVWDPACAFGVNGAAWFLTIASDPAKERRGDGDRDGSYTNWKTIGRSFLPLYHSTDAGASWKKINVLGFIDNADITIDRTSGKYAGRIYIYGNTFPWTSLWLIYSTDGGKTFVQSAETKLEAGETMHGGPCAILPDGSLLLPYNVHQDRNAMMRGQSTVAVAASTDGGANIGRPITVAPKVACNRMKDANTRDPEGAAGFTTTNIVADHSSGPFRGRAYAQWASMDRNQCAMFVAYSDDGGRKWSAPIKVSDAPLGRQQGPDIFLPQIAVNKDGVVGATWYDRREASNGKDHRLRFSASLDGGDTWLPSVPVSTHSFVFKERPEWRASAHASGGGRRGAPDSARTDVIETMVFPGPRLHEAWNNGMGDYAAIAAAADGRFHTFWIDNRSGVAQMYTAAVTVAGAPLREGAPELAGLENVTKLVELQYTKSVYDPVARTLSLEFQLLNTSNETIAGPLKLRLLGMSSDVGPPAVVMDGARIAGPGAIIDLSASLPPGGLPPGVTSGLSTLTLRFLPGQIVLNPRGNTDIARMRARVFGKRKK